MAACLHVIDPASAGDAALWSAASLLRRDDSARAAVIGSSDDARRALRWGLGRVDAIAAPLGRAELAWPTLRRLCRERTPRVVHAWSARAMVAAALAVRGMDTALVASLPAAPCGGPLGAWSARIARGRADALLFDSERAARAWGLLEEGVVAPAAPAEPGALPAAGRAEARAGWRASPGDAVIAVLTEPGSPLEAASASFLLGILTLAGRGVVGVAPSAHNLERAERFVQRLGRRWAFTVDPRPLPEWLGACDAAIWRQGRGGAASTPGFAARWALALGVPLIVEGDAAGLPAGAAWEVRPGHNQAAGALLAVLEGRAAARVSAMREAGLRHAREADPEEWAARIFRIHARALGLAASGRLTARGSAPAQALR